VFADVNNPPDLVGWWTFDDKFGHDYSPYTNTIENLPPAGPAFCKLYSDGRGASLYFNGESQATVPHISYYYTSEFTICFWVYLIEDSTGSWRVLLHKGNSEYEMTPSVMLWPKERRLHVRASTEYYWNEGLDSVSLVNIRRWTHLAVVGSGQLMQLYVNAYLDSQAILKAPIKQNSGDIYLGKDPWHVGFEGYLDDLRFYSKTLQEKDLKALAMVSIPLSSGLGVMLGCQLCNYMEAVNSCRDSYHLCSLEELYSGPYEMARAMGWFRFTSEIWTRNTNEQVTTSSDEIQDSNLFKLALCCIDY